MLRLFCSHLDHLLCILSPSLPFSFSPPPFPPHMLYMLLCRFFTSVRTVLQGACHMVAMQIACEPLVRQTLRQVFQSRAVICTKPTKKGRKVVALKHSSSRLTLLSNLFLLPSSSLSPSSSSPPPSLLLPSSFPSRSFLFPSYSSFHPFSSSRTSLFSSTLLSSSDHS